ALGQLKIPHGAVGGIEAVGDLVLALLQGTGQRGPDELHAEPHEDGETRHLAEQRHVDIHAFNLTISVSVDQLSCDGQGSGTNAGGNNEDQVHGDTDGDDGDGVDQTGEQEHFALQHGAELGLTGGAFDQFATEKAHTQGGTDGS